MTTIPQPDGSASTHLYPEAIKAVADLLGGDTVIAYRPYFAHVFGGAANALMLSQCWFWTNTPTVKNRDGDGWFWKSQAEMTEETGLTRREILTARRDLVAIGVLAQEVRGVPATVHYRINKDRIYELLWAYIQSRPDKFAQNVQSGLHKTSKLVRGKRVNKNARSEQTITDKTPTTNQRKNQRSDILPSASPEKTETEALIIKRGAAMIKAAIEAGKRGSVVA